MTFGLYNSVDQLIGLIDTNVAVEEAKNLEKPLLGVDYETMNPTARGFWEKYFTPYTISLVRRIDVGI